VAGNVPQRPDLLAQWSRASIPTEWSTTPPDRRKRLVSAIVGGMERSPGPRFTARARYWTFAAAAGVALLGGVGTLEWRIRESSEPVAGHLLALFGPPSTVIHGREAMLVGPAQGTQPVAFESHLDTGRESASRLELASGVVVAVGSDTHVVLPHVQDRASGREELGLDGGYVYVDVPKLRPGHFFGIRTPDTQVTVHGTSFSVEVSESRFGPISTTVSVTDGVVTVQRAGEPEIFLTAGTRWVSTVAPAPASTAPSASPEIHLAAPTVPRASLDVSGAKAVVVGSDAHRVSSVGQTRLAEQNRLFADAMTARDRGDDAVAIQMLEGFIRQFPACPLTEDAHVELFRAFVHRGDRGEAARIARQYLAVYSDGFARDEARVLAFELVAPPLP
jgi:hypothetical protein